MCVFEDRYYKITATNYIFKTCLCTTFHMYPSRPWLLKVSMFALLLTREIATYSWPWEKTGDGKYTLGLLLILISKSWGLGMPFLASDTCAEGGGGCYLFLPGFFSLYDAIHGWMTGRMDGKLHEKRPRHPLLYVILVNVNGKPTLCKRTHTPFGSWMLTHPKRPLPLG